MHVVVMMAGRAVVVAERVFQGPTVVKHFMDYAFVEKSFNRAVDGNAIVIFRNLSLDI